LRTSGLCSEVGGDRTVRQSDKGDHPLAKLLNQDTRLIDESVGACMKRCG
jgi:hypothetical protein